MKVINMKKIIRDEIPCYWPHHQAWQLHIWVCGLHLPQQTRHEDPWSSELPPQAEVPLRWWCKEWGPGYWWYMYNGWLLKHFTRLFKNFYSKTIKTDKILFQKKVFFVYNGIELSSLVLAQIVALSILC